MLALDLAFQLWVTNPKGLYHHQAWDKATRVDSKNRYLQDPGSIPGRSTKEFIWVSKTHWSKGNTKESGGLRDVHSGLKKMDHVNGAAVLST